MSDRTDIAYAIHGDTMTDKQKKMISYRLGQAGIKGETFNWEIDTWLASGVIDKMINSGVFHAMKELELNGFSFTKEDWQIASEL